MAKRKIIKIDSDKCNGCGLCIPNCPEGAIQMIDKKARLISDLFCDGLGACLGHCPQGAITIEEREAVEYDEKKTMENIVKHGENTIKAHLEHLKSHGQDKYYKEALEFLKERGIDMKVEKPKHVHGGMSGCPGSRMMDFTKEQAGAGDAEGTRQSQLRQWPIQLHLVSPIAPYFQKADVLLSADCVAYTVGDFHKDYLKGKSLAIACPKLDEGKEIYIEKIKSLIDDAKINTLTVMTMEVPCCHGLVALAQEAAQTAKRKIPIKSMIVSLKGKVLSEEWL
ncbi:MAG: 4Fe-4S ferredoxin [Candidatus Omnitrophica bacterium CG12_big_fil_rev_8_21_14_0_65_43_15]|uniref:4Fe-4S ferredoxin n=1 Tax=Candidatus Taenaricola geysiri TaxID=1974752 RepID=A0A2J0LDS4_9BACT|nr:MAG: 4Fe-4S ferredoxin [Candidatus Omnitrophica bacterium CG1_02_43_210]PIR65709.1 MAG: 4Fe-4S ferredoxin [Candidatus Omnitrophica bacterium CG10_big_fil_rev_8_21_14_0_10_43_8]PIV11987.1 MAG: 4Fe-4S ferredoxin [Candidatus Omnitrophica bacterium CG03_land_8_20_14_0_80_43_22]PIW66005.1 MAG: 4Fe-4S ferredoxin [Candidatus Omnitrophica bacterium CG12_big_fil_rev_8_21_14_0_65_43_15]PIW80861.1 MAG: 4Fe-4S ferredoxin [Candidatus Omnitrophica bacterium CG_4_8_14_3_um_filter_43_15]PIY84384.1 MAG: 4Fe